MSYTVSDIPAKPATRRTPARKELQVDGELIAYATDLIANSDELWQVRIGDVTLNVKAFKVDPLFRHLGELLSPTKLVTILLNEGELDLAPLGSLWTSTYNDGTYRRTLTGWEYQPPTDMFGPGFTALSRGISNHAYPLTAKK